MASFRGRKRCNGSRSLSFFYCWAGPIRQENGQHTGKVFEYFGARRPILAVGGVAGVLTEVLEETGTGTHALSKAQLRQFLTESYAEFSNAARSSQG